MISIYCWLQRHGDGTLKTLQGNEYKGKFGHNLMHGHGIMKYSNGDLYEGSWKNGMVCVIYH